MSFLIWPLAMFIASYFIKVPNYFGSKIQIYIYLILIIIYIVFVYKGKVPKILISKKIMLFLSITLVLQFIAIFISYFKIDLIDYKNNPIKMFINFCIFFLVIFIHYYIMLISTSSFKSSKAFVKGGLFALIISFIVASCQLTYIFFPSISESIVSFIGKFFEARWKDQQISSNPYGYYSQGSYVQTLKRINGLTEEASNFVTQLFIGFTPFLIASVKNKYNVFQTKKDNLLLVYVLLILSFVFFIMAQTTSGFLFAFIVFLVLYRHMSKYAKYFFLSAGVLITLLVLGYNIKNNYIADAFNNYIFNKQGNSNINRAGNTLALLKIFISNIFIGVGFDNQSYFLYINLPEWARHNSEYFMRVQNKYFPVLSVFLGWLSSFGILIVSFVYIYIYKFLKKFKAITITAQNMNHPESIYMKTIYDSSFYFFCFTFISSLFAYVWYASIYLILFFFFICFYYHAEHVIYKRPESVTKI
ncbi:hypothetical protein GWJ21_15155 [Bacillus coagulans]|uniref:hypothetical protein n=1 Tax=Heyndrickxia coagulans TaxID=1398 RepID=UPI001378612B|nr:hypothetical protein [Heyndrickxia coagulans]NCG69192.1 hypothetical protein [Heyndrickxia coagulans]